MKYNHAEHLLFEWNRYNKKEVTIEKAKEYWSMYEKWKKLVESHQDWILGTFSFDFNIGNDYLMYQVRFKEKHRVQGLRIETIEESEREYERLEKAIHRIKMAKSHFMLELKKTHPDKNVSWEQDKLQIGEFQTVCKFRVTPLPQNFGGVHNHTIIIQRMRFSEYHYLYEHQVVEKSLQYTEEMYQKYIKSRLRGVLR